MRSISLAFLCVRIISFSTRINHWQREPAASGWRGTEDGSPRQVVGFSVETRQDVDELFERVTSAGRPGLQVPYDAFWGARYAIVQDPDGRAIGIMSPVDPRRRSRPPELG